MGQDIAIFKVPCSQVEEGDINNTYFAEIFITRDMIIPGAYFSVDKSNPLNNLGFHQLVLAEKINSRESKDIATMSVVDEDSNNIDIYSQSRNELSKIILHLHSVVKDCH